MSIFFDFAMDIASYAMLAGSAPYCAFTIGTLSFFAQGQLEQAAVYLNRVFSSAPHSVPVRKALATVQLRLGNAAVAEELLVPVVENFPNDVEAASLLGRASMAQGKTDQGIEYLKRAAASSPERSENRLRLGIGLLQHGETALGLKELEIAAGLEQEDTEANEVLILALAQNREFDRALEAANKLQVQRPDSPVPHSIIGGIYLAQGRPKEARAAFDQALKLSPGDPAASHGIATIEMQAGNLEGARAAYRQVLEYHPDHVRTLVHLASLARREGEAEAWLDKAIKAKPEAVAPRVFRARYYLKGNEPAQALAILEEVKQRYSHNILLLLEMAKAEMAMGQAENALASLRVAVREYPESREARLLLAQAYAETGDIKGLRAELDVILKKDPTNIRAKIAVVRVLALEERIEEADKQVKELREAFPDNADVLAEQAWLALKANRTGEAIEAYRKALRLVPSSTWTVNLARAYWRAGKPDQGLAVLQGWLDEHSKDVLAQFALAEGFLALDRKDEARTAYTRLLQLAPKTVMALNNLAWLLRKDDPAKALKYGEQALELAPTHPAIMDTVGMLLLDKGEVQRAVRLLESAAENAPKRADIGYHLALALEKNGEKVRARQVLSEALKQPGGFPERKDAQDFLKQLGG